MHSIVRIFETQFTARCKYLEVAWQLERPIMDVDNGVDIAGQVPAGSGTRW